MSKMKKKKWWKIVKNKGKNCSKRVKNNIKKGNK